MPINQELNAILKEMWRIDEKIEAGDILTVEELDFWNANLIKIQDYYSGNRLYWGFKSTISS